MVVVIGIFWNRASKTYTMAPILPLNLPTIYFFIIFAFINVHGRHLALLVQHVHDSHAVQVRACTGDT
jgi:hypothetical protein